MSGQTTRVSQLLEQLRQNQEDKRPLSELFPLVYDQLRHIAENLMRRERAGHTLQATALVNEAYARLFDGASLSWNDRIHFFRAAAQSMRSLLIDYARHRAALKNGGGLERVPFGEFAAPILDAFPTEHVPLIDPLITEFAALRPRAAEVLVFRLFAGMSVEQTAEALAISSSSVKGDYSFGMAWLRSRLQQQLSNDDQCLTPTTHRLHP